MKKIVFQMFFFRTEIRNLILLFFLDFSASFAFFVMFLQNWSYFIKWHPNKYVFDYCLILKVNRPTAFIISYYFIFQYSALILNFFYLLILIGPILYDIKQRLLVFSVERVVIIFGYVLTYTQLYYKMPILFVFPLQVYVWV